MARTSKRKRRLESQELFEKKTEKAYVAGVYARLSVDHQDGEGLRERIFGGVILSD